MAAFEHHEVQGPPVFLRRPQCLGRRAHPAGVATDHDHAFAHSLTLAQQLGVL